MLESHETARTVGQEADRRSNVRRKVTALSYIQAGEANSGFVLDISEGGLSFQPFAGIESAPGDVVAPIRFQLPHSSDWIESAGKIIWTSEERVAAGIQFVNLSESARARIREWILSQDLEIESNTTRGGERIVPAAEALADLPRAASLAPTSKGLNEAPPDKGMSAHVPAREPLIPSMFSAPASVPQMYTHSQHATNGSVQVVVKLPSRWMVPLLVSILVVVSFALGVSVGHGSLDHWLGTDAPEAPPKQNSTSGAGGPPSVREPAATDAPSAQNPAADDGEGNPGPVNAGTAWSPPDDGPGASRRASSESSSRGAPSSGQTMLQDTPQGLVSIFIEREHSVTASATAAIASRRSIALLLSADGKIAEPPPTFHFGALLNHTDPTYPPQAIEQQIEGTVELRATIGKQGNVVDVQPLSGPEALVPASIAAVRIWQYKPTYLNGHPVETIDTLRITFRLPH